MVLPVVKMDFLQPLKEHLGTHVHMPVHTHVRVRAHVHTQATSWYRADHLSVTGQLPCPRSGPGLEQARALLQVARMELNETSLGEMGEGAESLPRLSPPPPFRLQSPQ